jgi:UDP-glucuronate 4-epimerase
MRAFLTGSAGFVGFHLANRLLADGHEVFGYDGITPYYDIELKRRRTELLVGQPGFHFVEAMLEDVPALSRAIDDCRPEVVLHLAGQAGVRYSLEAPAAYVSSNVLGTMNLLEQAKEHRPAHLLLASTSSVYGDNELVPFKESDHADHPLSLYAATKKAGEAMSHAYAHLWKIPTTCFRFFTVYGPWGRPDMALFKFVAAILSGEPIDVYGGGQMRRDFTAVEDLVEAVMRLIDKPPVQGSPVGADGVVDSLSPVAPWRVVNIAGGKPRGLLELVAEIEAALGRKAAKQMLPMQRGDVEETFADPGLLAALTGYVPATPITQWVKDFVEWYRAEYEPVAVG